MNLAADLEALRAESLERLRELADQAAAEQWRVDVLGRNGRFTQLLKGLKDVASADRPRIGQLANQCKQDLEEGLKETLLGLGRREHEERFVREAVDVTLPGRRVRSGSLHVATQTLAEVERVLSSLGFSTFRSRDVELDDYNFQLLNIPEHHPARDMQDTFYVASGGGRDGANSKRVLLRTHTSGGQIHAMRLFSAMNPENPPPLRISLPGLCYRNEQITSRSEIQFHQVEGLAVGRNVSMANLRATVEDLIRGLFGEGRKLRFRNSYFPFTEPSAEVDMSCLLCDNSGCQLCKYTGWLEILGCGMVHPSVLRNGGYDPERYTGFAFGMGPERIAMLKYGIEDIRSFWGNDLRFLSQFEG